MNSLPSVSQYKFQLSLINSIMAKIFTFYLLIISISGKSQNIDSIINKHIAAIGSSRLDSFRSITMEGSFQAGNGNNPFVLSISHNTGVRFNLSTQGLQGFIIITKEKGWNYFPFYGMKKPEPMNTEELSNYLPLLDLQGELYRNKEKGNTVAFAGFATEDDIDCYKLSVTMASGKTITEYIDTATNYIIKKTSTGYLYGKQTLIENRYNNYKKTDEGYVVPFAFTIGPGKAFIRKVTVNAILAPSLFEPEIK
jgi:hypothetical protein